MKKALLGLLILALLLFVGCKKVDRFPQLEQNDQKDEIVDTDNTDDEEEIYISDSEKVEAMFGEAPEDGPTQNVEEVGTLNEPESIPEGAIVEQIEEEETEELEVIKKVEKEDYGIYKKVEKDSLADFKKNETDEYEKFKKTKKLFGN